MWLNSNGHQISALKNVNQSLVRVDVPAHAIIAQVLQKRLEENLC